MQAIICVLSAVQWQQQKYRHHEGFQAHIRAADVIVINRYEHLNTIESQDLQQWLVALNKQANIIWLEPKVQNINKPIDSRHPIDNHMPELTAYLNILSMIVSQQRATANQSRINLDNHLSKTSMTSTDIAKTNANNELPYHYHDEQQNMLLSGWCLPAHWVFNFDQLKAWLLQLPNWQRIKGIIHTSKGWLEINFTPDSLTISPTKAQTNSRLEIILEISDINNDINNKDNWAAWNNELMALTTE